MVACFITSFARLLSEYFLMQAINQSNKRCQKRPGTATKQQDEQMERNMWLKWLCAIGCSTGVVADAAASCEASSGTRQMPVIELYTSEGCSSCPPADAWLARQDSRRAILLAWHVDYWNYLGWPDPLSQPAFSARQRQQAAHFGSQVYTPQFMLNGAPQPPGDTPSPQPAASEIELALRAQPTGSGWQARLTVGGKPPADTEYLVALVGAEEKHAVRGGENAGRLLHHAHPVLGYWRIAEPARAFDIPRPKAGKAARLVA